MCGAAKPIDILAKYVHDAGEGRTVEPEEPHLLLPTLTLDELDDLHADITVYLEIERVCALQQWPRRKYLRQDINPEYWADMLVVCEYELDEHRRHRVETDAKHHDLRSTQTGINKAVHDRIKGMLMVCPLRSMRKSILTWRRARQARSWMPCRRRFALASAPATRRTWGRAATDRPWHSCRRRYWETLLVFLKAYLAKARLRERHQQILEKTLDSLRHVAARAPERFATRLRSCFC